MIVPGANVHLRSDKGQLYRQPSPFRFVIHTMECDPERSLPSLINDAATHEHPPQLWCSLPELAKGGAAAGLVQCIDTNLSGEALEHPEGTGETNHAHAIQIECAGRAKDTHKYPVEWWEALGEHVIGPVAAEHNIDLSIVLTFYGEDAGFTIASSTARQRMSLDEWLNFPGVCGHQHVYANEHWDPAKVPIEAILAAARRSINPTPPSVPTPDPSPGQLLAAGII